MEYMSLGNQSLRLLARASVTAQRAAVYVPANDEREFAQALE